MTRSANQHRGGRVSSAREQRRPAQRPHRPVPHAGYEPDNGAPPAPDRDSGRGAAPGWEPAGGRTSAQPLRARWNPVPDDAPPPRPGSGRRRPPRRRGLRGFLRGYGWRIYAVPLLAVLTVLAVMYSRNPPSEPALSAQPAAPIPTTTPEPTPLVPNPLAAEKYDAARASAELPGGGPFTEQGAGTWSVVPGSGPQLGTGTVITYSVEIENGVQLPGGPEGFARTVDSTLGNPKSWIGSGSYAFQRVDTGTPRIRISLASQATARTICGFRIPFDSSCWRGGRAILSAARWERGAVVFQGNVVAYQQYVVNHEVGHGLGFGHKPCVENGGLAPIMMQQTWGVSNDYLAALGTDNAPPDGKACLPNPWPYPTNG